MSEKPSEPGTTVVDAAAIDAGPPEDAQVDIAPIDANRIDDAATVAPPDAGADAAPKPKRPRRPPRGPNDID